MKKKIKLISKPLLSSAALKSMGKEFDDPDYLPRNLPLSAEEKQWVARSFPKRAVGRPKRGKGCKRVLVSMEKGLLQQADAFARTHKMTRSQLIARGLSLAMSA